MFEVNKALSKAKTNKAVGIDHLPNEGLKSAKCAELLFRLYNAVFESAKMPTIWLKAVIVPIPKSRLNDPRVPLSYRGISLLSTVSKI